MKEAGEKRTGEKTRECAGDRARKPGVAPMCGARAKHCADAGPNQRFQTALMEKQAGRRQRRAEEGRICVRARVCSGLL